MADRSPAFLCLLSALLFGASTPLAKLLLSGISPFTLAGLLYLGAAIAVAPNAYRAGLSPAAFRAGNMGYLLGAIVFGGIFGPVLLLKGLDLGEAASVSLWLNLETVATSLLAWAFFREDMGARTWAAMILVTAGGVVLAAPFEGSAGMAAVLVVLACFCWGLDNNYTALIDGLTPSQSTFAKGLVAGCVNLAIGLKLEGGMEQAGFSGGAVIAALVLGGLSYGASISLYIRGAQDLGAARSQMVFSTAPFFGLVIAWVVVGETALLAQFAAAGLMILGLGLMLRGQHIHEHRHRAQFHTHMHRHDDGHHNHSHDDLPPSHRHSHPHDHEPLSHMHPHRPDLHHRHDHDGESQP